MRPLATLLLLLLPPQLAAQDLPTVAADLVLRGGTLVDGSGQAGKPGDVAVRDGKIVAVGQFAADGAAWVIDCQGLIVAPGFIDLHNHSDKGIVRARTRANVNFLLQGCTTILTGNCGSGPVDVAKYLKALDQQGAGTNVAHLLPQGSLRSQVIGTINRPPSDAELRKMIELTEQAMKDGAWGMSTGLIYVPSSYADTDELVALAEAVARHDGIYASHMRNEGTRLLEAVDELLEIGRRAKLPVHISHFKSSGREAWGLVREAVRKVDDARSGGQAVTADQYPYIASSTSLDATLIPAKDRAGGRKALVKRLDDPKLGPPLKEKIAAAIVRKDDGRAVRFANYAKRPDWAGRSLAQVAQEQQRTPLEIALEVTRNGGASIVNFSMNEQDVRHVMAVPWVATASDGSTYLPGADKPHPRFYGTFARKLGHYCLGEKVLPLEQAVRSASGLPADILQLTDRGYLRKDMAADIVVFDPDQFIDKATFDDPHQYAVGARYVLVNGQMAVHRGRPTGALAGKPLRKK